MSSSKDMLQRFDITNYEAYTFYECDKGHPFVAFTTCYCPMCDVKVGLNEAQDELDAVERTLDNCQESHENLIVRVARDAPELLI